MNHADFSQKINQMRARVEALFDRAGSSGVPTAPAAADDTVEELRLSAEELRVAEEELRQQNEELAAAKYQLEAEQKRYRDLFDFAPEGYLVTDRYGKILEANLSAALLLNTQPEFLSRKFLAAYVAEQDRRSFRQGLSRYELRIQALASQKARRPEHFLTRDPEWEVRLQPAGAMPFDAALSIAAVQDGEDLTLRWSVRDISERRLAQEALQESEMRFRTLAETAAAAILIVQAEKIVYANPAACETTGTPASELLGREFLSLVHPDYRVDLQQQGVGSLAGESTRMLPAPVRRELRFVTHAREDCWVDLTAGLMRVQEMPAWLITAYNITRRVQVEKARTELLRRLVDAQEEERLRISRELHDQMGQSLSALVLGLKTVESGAPSAYLPRLQQMISIADELEREIHQLALDLRPTALEDLGLSATLANYAEEWSGRHSIEVDYQSTIQQDEGIPIQAALAVYRIVQEALTNVVRHAQARKVSLILTVGSEPENWTPTNLVTHRQHRPGSLLVIIEDDGLGFEVEEMLHQRPSKGRLGFLGMKERAELLGGTLEIESQPGRGTAIFVRIPVVPPEGNDERG